MVFKLNVSTWYACDRMNFNVKLLDLWPIAPLSMGRQRPFVLKYTTAAHTWMSNVSALALMSLEFCFVAKRSIALSCTTLIWRLSILQTTFQMGTEPFSCSCTAFFFKEFSTMMADQNVMGCLQMIVKGQWMLEVFEVCSCK